MAYILIRACRLLLSWNGSESIKFGLPFKLYQDRDLSANGGWKDFVDFEQGAVPFLCFQSDEEAIAAEKKIDTFVDHVLMPLVVKTNALVICSPSQTCTLGMRFTLAAKRLAPTFGFVTKSPKILKSDVTNMKTTFLLTIVMFRGNLPFTILGMDSAANYLEVIVRFIICP